MSNTKKRILVSYFILSSILFIPLLTVSGDYNLQVGDTFYFKVKKMYNQVGLEFTIINTDIGITIRHGSEIELTITYFNELDTTAHIKYEIIIDEEQSEEFALFSNIIFLNRNWEELEEEYSEPVYESFSTRKIWGVRSTVDGELEVEYQKADGVLNKFYAYDYSALVSLGAKEVLIERKSSAAAGISWYFTLPSFTVGILVFLYVRKKRNTK